MSQAKKRTIIDLSDADSDSDHDPLGEEKGPKPVRKQRGPTKKENSSQASGASNGATKGQRPTGIERFCREQDDRGAFAWPTFKPPAKKAKPDLPSPCGTPGTQNSFSVQLTRPQDTSIWAAKYIPALEEELAVHKKKIGEVKAWLETHQSENSGSKVLLLMGPPGAGKSTTVHLLCNTLNLQVLEWQTPVPTLWDEHKHLRGFGFYYSSKMDDFQSFLDKAEKFPSIPLAPSLASLSLDPSKAPGKSIVSPQQGKVVLIDDMPLAVEGEKRQRLCDMLETLARSARFPTVVILSEGEAGQSGQGDSQPRWGATAAFQQALERWGATKISLNPITSANICKALRRIADTERYDPSEEELTTIADDSRGDLRQALATLQFHCLGQSQSANPPKRGKKRKAATKRKKAGGSSQLDDSEDLTAPSQNGTQPCGSEPETMPGSQALPRPSIGNRDSGLSLFHALGKFLYNKRQGDDVSAEVALRPALRRPPMASSHPPETILARSNLDGPAVTAFLHENLLQFVDDDAIDDVMIAASYFSDADHILRRRLGGAKASPAEDQGGEPDPGRVGHAAAASVSVRGVLFGLMHPAPRRWLALRAPVSGQVERRRMETMAEIQRASLSQSSSYLAPGAAGSVVLAVELLPFMKHIETLRKWRPEQGAGPFQQVVSETGGSMSSWAPVFEIDRQKISKESEEDVEEIEEW